MDRGKKRKIEFTSHGSVKRACSVSSEDDADVHGKILLLENEIFESKKNYNNISELIRILRNSSNDHEEFFVTAISLGRVFTRLLAAGRLEKKELNAEKEILVVKWLRERYAEYKKSLLHTLEHTENSQTVLTLCMRMLKTEGQYLKNGQDYVFPRQFLKDIIHILLKSHTQEDVRKQFTESYVEEYDDIRYYTFESIEKIMHDGQSLDSILVDHALEILTAIEIVPDSNEDLEDFLVPPPSKKSHALYSLNQHKRRGQEAWLAIMKLKLKKQQIKTILGQLTNLIAPWFIKPELLMDFLTDSYDAGGATSLLALSGVFYLIQERNLDYPLFYHKLYSLLDENLLHSKHRSRFLRLLDTFLASTHLPAVLVASFIKRLSRLCLNAPPAGIVAIVPWVYNLLKKHPTCTFMIHREPRTDEERETLENEGLDDPFDMEEQDPMETKAIESCLWELVMLQSHYHPNVATLAKIISEQFTKHAYNLEDFLDHSYGSMLEAELSKGVKVPVVEYNIPKKILTKYEDGMGEDSLLVKLWNFT